MSNYGVHEYWLEKGGNEISEIKSLKIFNYLLYLGLFALI